MYAPPLSNTNYFKLSNMNCSEPNHQNNPIVGICIDEKCQIENKFMCLDCIFDNHSTHKGVKSQELEEIFQQNLKEFQNTKILNKEKNNEMKNFLKEKIDKFKKNINKYIDEYYNKCLNKIEKNTEINKENEINMIQDNFPPKNNDQLLKLKEGLLLLYKNHKENNQKKNEYNNNHESYKIIILDELKNCEKSFINFKNNSLIDLETKFEWSTDYYTIDGFCYKLEENNSKATKILISTITICKAAKPLEKGFKYQLDYYINYISGAFDVGFGDISINTSLNGLAVAKCYSVCNCGVYTNGKQIESTNYFENTKKISFFIDLINFKYEIFLNDIKKFDFSCDPQFFYYPMVAMGAINNSVKGQLRKWQ